MRGRGCRRSGADDADTMNERCSGDVFHGDGASGRCANSGEAHVVLSIHFANNTIPLPADGYVPGFHEPDVRHSASPMSGRSSHARPLFHVVIGSPCRSPGTHSGSRTRTRRPSLLPEPIVSLPEWIDRSRRCMPTTSFASPSACRGCASPPPQKTQNGRSSWRAGRPSVRPGWSSSRNWG